MFVQPLLCDSCFIFLFSFHNIGPNLVQVLPQDNTHSHYGWFLMKYVRGSININNFFIEKTKPDDKLSKKFLFCQNIVFWLSYECFSILTEIYFFLFCGIVHLHYG